MRLQNYINEASLKVGDYIVQKQSDYNIYALIIGQLKNGAFKVISKSEGTPGPAKIGSTKGWYPAPTKVGKMKIDGDTLSRIHKKRK